MSRLLCSIEWVDANGPSCIVSAMIVVLDSCLAVTFYTLMQLYYWRTSGVLEWTMAFTGAFYLWAFVGFVSVPEEGIDEAERRALLGASE